MSRGCGEGDEDATFSSPGKAQKGRESPDCSFGIISHLTAKSGGNVHDRGVIEITANSVSETFYPQNTADIEIGLSFCSDDKPSQWICLGFKTLRIEPTHYTIRTGHWSPLKSWAVEGSDDGVSWTEIDRRENNRTRHDPRKTSESHISAH
jgi:hypothetical protein